MAVTSGSMSTALITDDRGIQRNLVFTWSRSSTNNTVTTISWELRGGGTVTPSDEKYVSAYDIKVTIDGSTKYQSSSTINLSYNTLVASGSYNVIHSSTTSEKSFSASIEGRVYTSTLNSKSGTWVLPAISSYTAATMTISYPSSSPTALIVGGTQAKGKPTFSFSNVNSSLYYQVYWKVLNNGVEGESSAIYNYGGTIPGSELNSRATSWSGIYEQYDKFNFPLNGNGIRFLLYTYKGSAPSGSNIVGSYTQVDMNVAYDESLNPGLSSINVSDSSGYYNSNSKFLKTISYGSLSTTFTLKQSATLKSYSVLINDNSRSVDLSNNNLSCSFTGNDYSNNQINIKFSVTDSRGLNSEISQSINWDNYTKPTISTFTAARQSTVTNIKFTWINSGGTGTLTRKITSGSTTVHTPTSNNSNYTVSGFSADNSYTFVYTVSDAYYSTSATATVDPSTEFVLLEIKDDGTGISIGQAAESNKFIVGNMSSGIEFNNNLNVKGTNVNYYLNGIAFGDAITKNIYRLTNRGDLAWSTQDEGDSKVIAKSALAFWNGAFNGTGSNLMYCAAQNTGTAGARIIGLANGLTYGGPAVDYVIIKGTTTSADAMSAAGQRSGTWQYRKWNSGFLEVWFNGSIYLPAATALNGFLRATANVNIPSAVYNAIGDFADTAVVSVTGAYSARFYTSGGIKNSGKQFEAQILGANSGSISAASWAGWNVYISGPAR